MVIYWIRQFHLALNGNSTRYGLDREGADGRERYGQQTFGYYWMAAQKDKTQGMHLRNFNLSRYLALRRLGG